MHHVDLRFPSPAAAYAPLSQGLHRENLRRLAVHAPLSVAVLALVASGADLVTAWVRHDNAPGCVLDTAMANFRAAERLARREAAQRRRLDRKARRR